MEGGIRGRGDLISIFNSAHFMLRHYAKGYYPFSCPAPKHMSVNRMFFPLKNPNGAENYFSDSFRRYPLKPGKMYFIPAFLPAGVQLDRQLFFLSVQASLEIFPGVDLFSDCPRMLELPAPPEFASLLEIFDSADPQTQYLDAIRAGSLAYSMLLRMLDRYDPQDFWKPLALKRYVKLVDYLQENGNAQTSVQELAELEHESRESFTRKFTVCTGITPKQLIDRFVTSRCLSLMNQGFRFKTISEILRFRDEFSFSRYFKRNMGESPRNWQMRQLLG
ncbi:MAG: helix-turn-helix transcriptional regulator [Lentisphaeria bacterium]|nr:helix-turn-helix transcriptional regulator [Lentisphaeria bacterium]